MLKRRASLIVVIITMLFCFTCTPWAKANQPPVADAGPDQTIYTGDGIYLQGSAYDPDGDPIVSWTWTIEVGPPGSEPFLDDPNIPDPYFLAFEQGDYMLSLVVSDGIDLSAPDTVTIYVRDNLPPTAVASADVLSGTAPLTVQFDGSASSDPEGGPLSYRWAFGDMSPMAYQVSPSHVYEDPEEYVVTLVVTDERGATDSDILIITVYAEEPTPEGAIEDLIADVESMNLQQGIDNSLDTKLTSALDALEALNADQRNDAVNKLNAFINEVEAQRGKKLTNEQADRLIAAAQEVISLIP